jgi:hypothetical protein
MGDEMTLQVIASPLQHGVDDSCTLLVGRRDLVNPIIRESDMSNMLFLDQPYVHIHAIATLSPYGPFFGLYFW